MRNRKAAVTGFAVAAVAFAGACADMAPTEPPAAVPEAASLFGGMVADPTTFVSRDVQFARIAQEEVPGFAGIFRGDDGTLNIRMVPGAQRLTAAQARRALGGTLRALSADLAGAPVNILEAEYNFAQLHALHRRVGAVLGIDGVVYTGVDERANRVQIAVAHATARADVERALGQLGIDRAAVTIVESEPITVRQGLRDRVRPVAAGLQIMGGPDAGGFFWWCTHGFTVRSPAAPGLHGFVVNSHCTNVEYGLPTGTAFHQPNAPEFGGVDAFIGTEVHDVPLFTGNPCPAGRQCRWSDAAGARYAPGIDNAFGRIYRTTSVNTGSLTIDAANPMFTIVDERPFSIVGDVMHKVGRTTGWTSGTVGATCIDINLGGTPIPNLTILCSDLVFAQSAGGDSGSPVFDLAPGGGPNEVRLTGILYGGSPGQYVFSPMDVIRFEHPGPAPWITFPGQAPPAP